MQIVNWQRTVGKNEVRKKSMGISSRSMLSEISQTEKEKTTATILSLVFCFWDVEHRETESKKVVIMGEEVGKIEGCLSKFIKLKLWEMNKSRDSVYTVITVVKNTVFHMGNS